eukprot:3404307-Rhodomonas_salina.2
MLSAVLAFYSPIPGGETASYRRDLQTVIPHEHLLTYASCLRCDIPYCVQHSLPCTQDFLV